MSPAFHELVDCVFSGFFVCMPSTSACSYAYVFLCKLRSLASNWSSIWRYSNNPTRFDNHRLKARQSSEHQLTWCCLLLYTQQTAVWSSSSIWFRCFRKADVFLLPTGCLLLSIPPKQSCCSAWSSTILPAIVFTAAIVPFHWYINLAMYVYS